VTIRTRVATEEYRKGWDAVFGKKPRVDPRRAPCATLLQIGWPLNPHDATEHPEAD
jgi:hypothetical protein